MNHQKVTAQLDIYFHKIRLTKMADFDKAWPITASWEGKWTTTAEYEDKEKTIISKEEKYGGVWWGTNFGLTGTFMRDYTDMTADKKDVFQKMTRAECADIWKKTRWTWLKANQI